MLKVMCSKTSFTLQRGGGLLLLDVLICKFIALEGLVEREHAWWSM
jgi:hypothetical protein